MPECSGWWLGQTTKIRLLCNKGRVVKLERDTFAQVMASKVWIIIAERSRKMETLSAHAMNCPWSFPPPRFRNFDDFAKSFSLPSADDREACTKSIFHYLFEAVKYSWLAADIAMTAFRLGEKDCLGIIRGLSANRSLLVSRRVSVRCISCAMAVALALTQQASYGSSSTTATLLCKHSEASKTMRWAFCFPGSAYARLPSVR